MIANTIEVRMEKPRAITITADCTVCYERIVNDFANSFDLNDYQIDNLDDLYAIARQLDFVLRH